ncbi:MAG: AtpZ/AtpI family protein [Bacillus sp. (in: firmicutes)]
MSVKAVNIWRNYDETRKPFLLQDDCYNISHYCTIGRPLLIGIFIGRWLDAKLATGPLFMIIGLFLGRALGAYGISRLLKDKIQGD